MIAITRTTGTEHTTIYGNVNSIDQGHALLDALARSYQRTSPTWVRHHNHDTLTIIPTNHDQPISTYKIEEI